MGNTEYERDKGYFILEATLRSLELTAPNEHMERGIHSSMNFKAGPYEW
jgi:hypothetical protein